MSDTKETKKKGFFSKLLGRSNSADADKELEKNEDIKGSSPVLDNDSETSLSESTSATESTLSKSALAKMKKADIVAAAAELGVYLDIKLTKDKLLAAWDTHFNQERKLVYTGRGVDSPKDSSNIKVNDLDRVLSELVRNKKISVPVTNPIGCNIKWDGKEAHWMPAEACDLV